MNYGGPFIYPPISFPIPLSLFLRLLDILCPSQTFLPPFLPLCAIYLVRVPPIQARLSVQLREVAEASSWPNCSATYSARMHVLWVHVSVNFGNRYLDGLFAIFHYACGQCVCVCARALLNVRTIMNVVGANGGGEWNIYTSLLLSSHEIWEI